MSSPSSEPEPSESTSSNSMSSSRSPANNNIHIEIKSTTTIEKLPPTKSTVSLILTDSGNSPDVMNMCQNRWIVFPTYLITDIYDMLMFILLTVRLQITRFVGRVLKNHISFRVLTKKWSVYYQMALFSDWWNHLIVTKTNEDNVGLVYPHLPDGELVLNIRNRRLDSHMFESVS